MTSVVGDRSTGFLSPIVVGVDGSSDSWAAFAWAGGITGPNGALHVVRTVTPAGFGPGATSSDPGEVEQYLAQFEAEVAEATSSQSITCQVTCHLFEGHIADGLVEIASVLKAPLIAVGGHGRSSRRSKMVGGVVHRLLHDAEVPVAVVRTRPPVSPVEPGTLVVGIGDGPATVSALNWAASVASQLGLSVRLVHGATPEHRPVFNLERAMRRALEKVALLVDPDELLRWVNDDLSALVEELHHQPEFSGVPIATTAKIGPAGPILVAEADSLPAAATTMIVMGKHFDGPVTGYFTTAALHHVLTHASCPVVIVPQHAEAE